MPLNSHLQQAYGRLRHNRRLGTNYYESARTSPRPGRFTSHLLFCRNFTVFKTKSNVSDCSLVFPVFGDFDCSTVLLNVRKIG